jgi:transcription-repair coupling factor (superfamily II helicase)
MIGFNINRIFEIIMYEINRGGQVFFINNKVQNIKEIANMIRKICPQVRTEIGHGQMEGNELEKIVLDFIDGKFDIFVCTTIIESGMDIPNANTIIINDAQNFGLSDLHQLRGRVGRSNKKAFCYLITPPPVTLNEIARKRLKALVEYSDLGSGLQIAMRDLDIRGAGNLLGAEQSGFISEIGYDMYLKILEEALEELKYESNDKEIDYNNPSEFVKNCQLETDLSLLIPDNYVNNFNERLSLYKDLDSLKSEKQLLAFENRLRDRFGEPPNEVLELISAIKLRWYARNAGIIKIIIKNNKMTAHFFQSNDEKFYSSEVYNKILQYVMQNPTICIMKQSENNNLYIVFKNIENIKSAILIFEKIIKKNTL